MLTQYCTFKHLSFDTDTFPYIIGVGAGKYLGVRRIFCPNVPKFVEKFSAAKRPSTNFLYQSVTYHQLSPTLKHEANGKKVFLGVKKNFLEKKSQTFLFSQTHLSLSKKKRCRNFCVQIFRDFARIFDKSKLLGVCLRPQLLHHCLTYSFRTIRNAAETGISREGVAAVILV